MVKKLSLLLGVIILPAMLFAETSVDVSGIMGRSTDESFSVGLVELAITKELEQGVSTELFAEFRGESDLSLEEANLIITDPVGVYFGFDHNLTRGLEVKAGRQRLDFGIVNSERQIELQAINRPLAVQAAFGGNGAIADGAHLAFDFTVPTKWDLGVGVYHSDSLSGQLAGNDTTEGNIYTIHASTGFNLFNGEHRLGLSALLNNPSASEDDETATILGVDFTGSKEIAGHQVTVAGELLNSTYYNSTNDEITLTGGYGTLAVQLNEKINLATRLDYQDAEDGGTSSLGITDSVTRINLLLTRHASEHNLLKLQYVLEEEVDATLYAAVEFGLTR